MGQNPQDYDVLCGLHTALKTLKKKKRKKMKMKEDCLFVGLCVCCMSDFRITELEVKVLATLNYIKNGGKKKHQDNEDEPSGLATTANNNNNNNNHNLIANL